MYTYIVHTHTHTHTLMHPLHRFNPKSVSVQTAVMSYVLGVDIGTSSIRCVAIDRQGRVLSSNSQGVKVLHPQPGYSEMDPEQVWLSFRDAVKETLSLGHLNPSDADSMGIATQRNSFLLWKRETGQPLCNLITWQDRRSDEVAKEWNDSMQFKLIKSGASFMHFFTRSNRFLAASIVTLTTQQVAPKLYWAMKNIQGAQKLANEGKLCFGTMDSWILWKLTDGQVHATDYSNISTTLLFDPFQMKYSDIMFNVMGFEKSIVPTLKDTGGLFGHTAEHHFGASIPITCIIADQTSATFAQCCWNPGDLKCTMGTGMFLTINTGRKPHASLLGYYPVVGWKIGTDLTYLAEANFPSSGSVMEWGRNFGLYSNPSETDIIARSVPDSGGLSFVPAFDGIQVPHNDPCATAGMLGISHNTRKEHMVRALLESLAYTVKQVYDVGTTEIDLPINTVCVDGGVTNNDFIVQLASNLIGREIRRPRDIDQTVYGAVYVAGLSSGFWRSRDEVRQLRYSDEVFQPLPRNSETTKKEIESFKKWQQAVERCLGWYKQIENGHSV